MLGIALALLLGSLIGHAALLLLFAGLVAAYGWTGGVRSALAVAALAATAGNDLLPRFPSQDVISPIALALAAAYALEGVLASMLVSALREPRHRDGTGDPEAQQRRWTRAITGITMSGFGTDEDIRASKDAGFAEHLIKPIESRTLYAAIQRATSGAGRDGPDREARPA